MPEGKNTYQRDTSLGDVARDSVRRHKLKENGDGRDQTAMLKAKAKDWNPDEGRTLTPQFEEIFICSTDCEHIGKLIAWGHRGADEGQGPSWLLVLTVLVDEILKLAELRVQHKIPAWQTERRRVTLQQPRFWQRVMPDVFLVVVLHSYAVDRCFCWLPGCCNSVAPCSTWFYYALLCGCSCALVGC